MTIEAINLELIQDNPYQARLTYHKKDIDDLAHSIKEHGLLQVPPGRRVDGKVELCFGHLRKRAFIKLAKKEPEERGKMPVDIRDLTDDQMALYVLEENLKRRDISPLEIARAVDSYLKSFLEKTELEMAGYLNMTIGNVSNMRRVLRLPVKFLDKIDEGKISFTQGRELLTLEGFENAENLMSEALSGLKTGNKAWGESNTVEGLQKSIHTTVSNHFQPLEKEFQGYQRTLIFDTRAAGCLECDRMVRTHPTKSATAHFCLDKECWDRHQGEHREKAAAEAKAKMEADILKRVAEETKPIPQEISPEPPAPKQEEKPEPPAGAEQIVPEYTTERKGNSWIALDAQSRIIAIGTTNLDVCDLARESFKPVTTKLNPTSDDYLLNHTYRVIPNVELRGTGAYDSDVTAQNLATAVKALVIKPEDVESFKVWKSSGKVGTAGSVSAGWSKCTEPLDDLQKVEEQVPVERKEPPTVVNEGGAALPVPCVSCAKSETCDRSFFHVADDGSSRLVCEEKVDRPKEVLEIPPREIPADTLALAREKAGTRAEVLDLKDISAGTGYYQDVKEGYTLLDGVDRPLEHILDPEECLERCTHGFHYAFDSRQSSERTRYVCTDPKCLIKKKAAFTRAKNAEGQARKRAEAKAIRAALTQTFTLDRPRMKLILLTQMEGFHTSRNYFYGEGVKQPKKWLWDKVSAGVPEINRTGEALFKAIDKLSDEDLASLVVEQMFYFLTDKGDIGAYEIKTEIPLGWLGFTIEQEVTGGGPAGADNTTDKKEPDEAGEPTLED